MCLTKDRFGTCVRRKITEEAAACGGIWFSVLLPNSILFYSTSITMSTDTDHQKCVDLTIGYFQERGITCQDYEILVGDDPSKRPDLILPDFHTFLEAKTFSPEQKECEEEQRFGHDLMAGKVVTYWPPTYYYSVS